MYMNSQNDSQAIEQPCLAMAIVPFQKWGNLYEPCKGYCIGTIFKDLNKPFMGGCGK